ALPVAGYNYNSVWTPLLAGLSPAGMAASVSLAVRPRPGRSGHQCSHAPGRPILHRRLDLSQTSAGKLRLNYLIDSSSFDVVTAPGTARGSRGLGRRRIGGRDAREGAPLVENRPGDAGELVGQRNGEHVVVQPLFRRLDPRLEPVALRCFGPSLTN